MKTLILNIVFIIVAIAVGCQSPIDVEANRQKNIISFAPDTTVSGVGSDFNELDFGLLFRSKDTTYTRQIKIMNTTDKQVFISGIEEISNEYFSVDKSVFPITLEPKNKPGSSILLKVYFNPKNTGEFIDTLKFKNIPDVFIRLKATVPAVFVQDLVFDDTGVNDLNIKTIRIYNFGDKTAHVEQPVTIHDKDDIFKFLDKLPRSINSNGFINLQIAFIPPADKEYLTQIEFKIYSYDNGPIINYGLLKGKGIMK